MPKTLLYMALTGIAITYGGGQIISGICGDRISPKKLISYGLILTVFMNILIPFCTNHYQMLAVWCVNGFAQAFMWPPIGTFCNIFCHADRLYARCKCDANLHDTAIFREVRECIYSVRGIKFLHLYRQCHIYLWNSDFSRNLQLEIYCTGLAVYCIIGNSYMPGMCPSVGEKT